MITLADYERQLRKHAAILFANNGFQIDVIEDGSGWWLTFRCPEQETGRMHIVPARGRKTRAQAAIQRCLREGVFGKQQSERVGNEEDV